MSQLTKLQMDMLDIMIAKDRAGEIYGVKSLAKELDVDRTVIYDRLKTLRFYGRVIYTGNPKTLRVVQR